MSTCERDVSDEETGGDGTNIDGGECIERAARSVGSVVAVASVGVAEPRAAHHPLMKREEGEAQAAGPHRGFALFLRRWLRHKPSVQGVHSAHGRCGEAGERAGREWGGDQGKAGGVHRRNGRHAW